VNLTQLRTGDMPVCAFAKFYHRVCVQDKDVARLVGRVLLGRPVERVEYGNLSKPKHTVLFKLQNQVAASM